SRVFIVIAPARRSLSTLSLHDALPISSAPAVELVVPQREQPSFAARDFRMLGWTADSRRFVLQATHGEESVAEGSGDDDVLELVDRKSTRLNSSHVKISYAVFCLKKKK